MRIAWTPTRWVVSLAVVGLLIASPRVEAAFTAPPNGARPMGMGGAFTAIADDANASMFNPAGLANAGGTQAMFTRTAFFSGPADPLVAQDGAYLQNGNGSRGFGIGLSSLADRDAVYRETSFGVGYAQGFGPQLKVGVIAKLLQAGLDESNPDVIANPYFENGVSTSKPSLDLGILFEPVDGLTVGASGFNLVPADLRFGSETNDEGDDATQTFRVGTAYRLASVAAAAEQASLKGVLERSLVAVDFEAGDGTAFGGGAEIGFSQNIAGRVGFRSASGVGKSASAITVGGTVGFALGAATLQVDYGFDMASGDLKDNVSQRFSLRVAY
ncbi:MAG: conjugal transfer protein TraF [Candidatus Poribacteria bacterium]|nr:conjugal transfer protein TraF [Candidatus Poribacteria bacterium]